ncbi:hypothetical protein A45J_0918 [hot springs metagenome]
MIDERHYAFSKEKARQGGKGISQVLREGIEGPRKSDVCPPSSVSGIADGARCYGRDHDKWPYGKKWK